MTNPRNPRRAGFTLIELLVVIAVMAVLGGLSFTAWGTVQARSQAASCAAKMRGLGTAILLFGQDNNGRFPRSNHSAQSLRERAWAEAIAPYLGFSKNNFASQDWKAFFEDHYRCPSEKSQGSNLYDYGLNVFFELDPDYDDYEGAPATWRRTIQVPHPANTILMAEARSLDHGDHFMCHMWSGSQAARNAVAHDRHSGKSNFLFVDGHVETLSVNQTFDPATGANLWNPGVAQR